MSDWRNPANGMTIKERAKCLADAGMIWESREAILTAFGEVCLNAELRRHRETQTALSEEVTHRLGVEAERDKAREVVKVAFRAGRQAMVEDFNAMSGDDVKAALAKRDAEIERRGAVKALRALAMKWPDHTQVHQVCRIHADRLQSGGGEDRIS